jgi:hypothetical protein
MTMAESGDLVGAVAGVADEEEPAIREPDENQAQQPAHQLRRGPVRPIAAAVVLRRAVQVDQDRQRPGSGGEGEADQDREDDPLVAVPPSRVAVSGAHRVAVAGLAVDLLAGVAVDGVVADQDDSPLGHQVVQEEPCEGAAQFEGRPGGTGEDALVVGAVARREGAEGAQQVGDGAAAGSQEGGEQQGDEPAVGRLGESGRQRGDEREGLGW